MADDKKEKPKDKPSKEGKDQKPPKEAKAQAQGQQGKGKDKGDKGGDKAKAKAPEAAKPVRDPNYKPRLRTHYTATVIAALTKKFNYHNPMMVPRLKKIVVNMGLGAAVGNPKLIDSGVEDLRAITGQKPIVTRARKSIATFKLRENLPIGA